MSGTALKRARGMSGTFIIYDYKAPDTVTRAGRTYRACKLTYGGWPGSYSPDPWTEEKGGGWKAWHFKQTRRLR